LGEERLLRGRRVEGHPTCSGHADHKVVAGVAKATNMTSERSYASESRRVVIEVQAPGESVRLERVRHQAIGS
jgi:hypothetical protein